MKKGVIRDNSKVVPCSNLCELGMSRGGPGFRERDSKNVISDEYILPRFKSLRSSFPFSHIQGVSNPKHLNFEMPNLLPTLSLQLQIHRLRPDLILSLALTFTAAIYSYELTSKKPLIATCASLPLAIIDGSDHVLFIFISSA